MYRALLLFALLASSASANMSSPEEPGTPAGEPASDLAGLRVARETLTLDLRSLAATRLATVDAEYRIVNPGDARTVPLVFLALGDAAPDAQVEINGRPVPSLPLSSVTVPPSWTMLASTPALDGDAVPYATDQDSTWTGGYSFVLTIPPGQHTVRVRYGVRPGSYDDGEHPNLVWQLAYSLAPARRWAGFGQLDVRVLVPPGWEAATSLPLRRDGDALVGRFPGVPGDVLAVSARAPSPPLRIPFLVAGVLVALVIVGFFGAAAGRLVARSGRKAWAAIPVSLLAGALAAVALIIFVGVADDLGDSSAHGYRSIMRMVFFVGPAVLVGGAVLTQIVAVWATRRWRAEAPTAPTAPRR